MQSSSFAAQRVLCSQQLDPEKFGEYSRALAVGTEYGSRLLRRFTSWDDEKRMEILEKLVHGYPSHEYIIDYHELEEMGFNVKLFVDSERAAVQELFNILPVDQTMIDLVLPEEVRNRQADNTGSEAS